MAKTVEQVADAMYTMVKDAMGQKKLKPMDLTKAMVQLYGGEGVDKLLCKQAIKTLVDSGRLVYTYFGGSFLEVPHREGAAND
ncbi:MAG: hypothetical protein CVT49_04225 [candidate division Zixibacteria bacterium HGW-Zixibacteria-1]|nr:MAG: hypothetical protein CVT49_04225 [candidate division Zixibacteria bacterium HGW-Zixibacteria-1]